MFKLKNFMESKVADVFVAGSMKDFASGAGTLASRLAILNC